MPAPIGAECLVNGGHLRSVFRDDERSRLLSVAVFSPGVEVALATTDLATQKANLLSSVEPIDAGKVVEQHGNVVGFYRGRGVSVVDMRDELAAALSPGRVEDGLLGGRVRETLRSRAHGVRDVFESAGRRGAVDALGGYLRGAGLADTEARSVAEAFSGMVYRKVDGLVDAYPNVGGDDSRMRLIAGLVALDYARYGRKADALIDSLCLNRRGGRYYAAANQVFMRDSQVVMAGRDGGDGVIIIGKPKSEARAMESRHLIHILNHHGIGIGLRGRRVGGAGLSVAGSDEMVLASQAEAGAGRPHVIDLARRLRRKFVMEMGDFYPLGKRLLIGGGARTTVDGVKPLFDEGLLDGKEVYFVESPAAGMGYETQQLWMHLDMYFMALPLKDAGKTHVAVCEDIARLSRISRLRHVKGAARAEELGSFWDFLSDGRQGFEVEPFTLSEQAEMVGNSEILGPGELLSSAPSEHPFNRRLSSRGVRVHHVDISEIRKMHGGQHCITFDLIRR